MRNNIFGKVSTAKLEFSVRKPFPKISKKSTQLRSSCNLHVIDILLCWIHNGVVLKALFIVIVCRNFVRQQRGISRKLCHFMNVMFANNNNAAYNNTPLICYVSPPISIYYAYTRTSRALCQRQRSVCGLYEDWCAPHVSHNTQPILLNDARSLLFLLRFPTKLTILFISNAFINKV